MLITFFTAIMATRTRFSITLQVHFLCCNTNLTFTYISSLCLTRFLFFWSKCFTHLLCLQRLIKPRHFTYPWHDHVNDARLELEVWYCSFFFFFLFLLLSIILLISVVHAQPPRRSNETDQVSHPWKKGENTSPVCPSVFQWSGTYHGMTLYRTEVSSSCNPSASWPLSLQTTKIEQTVNEEKSTSQVKVITVLLLHITVVITCTTCSDIQFIVSHGLHP